ncbi:MAG: Ig-like domain-containing protein [Cocleimonas sp.]
MNNKSESRVGLKSVLLKKEAKKAQLNNQSKVLLGHRFTSDDFGYRAIDRAIKNACANKASSSQSEYTKSFEQPRRTYSRVSLLKRLSRELGLVVSLVALIGISTSSSHAEIRGDDAFLIAENVIAGLGKDGAFGSVNPIPVEVYNIHGIGGNKIGYLSDPSKNNFAGDYDGDFFYPGFPEEGWAVRVNGNNYNNNRNEQSIDVAGELSNFLNENRFSSVEWNGVIDKLEIKQTFRTYHQGLAIIIDVEMKNNSNTVMENVYFMRTVDPDNNISNASSHNETDPSANATGIFATTNSIEKQGDIDNFSVVSASQSRAGGQGGISVVRLSGYSANSRVAYGGERLRDPAAVYNGTGVLKHEGSSTEDKSIAVAFKFDKIKSGETVKFTHSYGLADLAIPNVVLDVDNSSGLGDGAFKQLYMLSTEAVPVVDEDVAITGTESQLLQGLKVKITNPSSGDKISITGAFPAGTSIDIDEVNSDTEINIKGSALVDEYMTLLKSIRFENPSKDSSLTTREIVIQVLDETFILSNSNIAKIFITVPLEIEPVIAGDNILSRAELDSSLPITGTASPNSNLEVVFTDGSNLEPVTKYSTVKPNGTWESPMESSELLPLAEGPITVDAKSTDQFGNITTDNAEFIKDTEVLLTVTSPKNGDVITDKEVLIEGVTDPEAEVKVTTPDGKECTTTADIDGKWSCTITDLKKGQTYPLIIEATDKVGNEGELPSGQPTITVNSIDLTVQSPTFEAVAEDSTPLITGKTEPYFKVTLTTEFGKVCTTTANNSGDWSCELAPMPSGGPHGLKVVAEDPETDKLAELPWRVAIPAVSLAITSPDLNAMVDDNTPKLTGTSDPLMEITVTTPFGNECTTTADSNGNWSCEFPDDDPIVSGGPYDFTVKAKDPVTESESELPWALRIPDVSLDVTEPDFNQMVDDETPVIKGTTDPSADITIEYQSGKKCTTVADSTGNWSCELDKLPSGGPYDLKVIAKDPRTKSVTEKPWKVRIDELELDITSPQPDDLIVASPLEIEGTTKPNADVTITGPNGITCNTKADSDGNWKCPLEGVQTGDNQEFSITATSPGGMEITKAVVIDVSINDGTVTTALKGGGGSFGSALLLLMSTLLFRRRKVKK